MKTKNFEVIVTTKNGTHRFNLHSRKTGSECIRLIFSFMKRDNITNIVAYPYTNNKNYEIETPN